MTDARESLKQMAARAGVSTRPANLVIRGAQDYFTVRYAFKSGGFRIEVNANSSLLHARLKCDSGAVFSTPRGDSLCTSLLGQVAGRDVYVYAKGQGSPAPWIYSPDAVAALTSFEMSDDEELSVRTNGLTAIVHSAGPYADWERIQRLVALARVLPPGVKEARLDRERLPEDLRDLSPLIKLWGISDDDERSDKASRAKTETLQRLLDAAEGRLARITEFLHQVGGDSDEASALDGLAQSVMEARLELKRRSTSRSKGRL